MRRTAAALTAVSCALLTGCGIRPTGIISAGDKPFIGSRDTSVTVYLVSARERLVPVVRPGLPGHPHHAVTQLGVRPTSLERHRGLRNAVPARDLLVRVADDPSMLMVDVDGKLPWPRIARAQVVCTAQTIAGIRRVMLVGLPDSEGDNWVSHACDEFADLLE
ncbi:hypothetical protein SAMN04489712_104455 [Thermomonospora echinospora]|uniref:Sporulation and spore germination n=1 Tax=Thermomonospora echinospora TaxID=1992 RepID=A0A1H5ZAU8_9ACTN|nr:hypothetical protein [Thermomonospora echinospora]SEG33431.1 hypothetical protein SAMN04489712_104455 [Thermomonospora echinospora]